MAETNPITVATIPSSTPTPTPRDPLTALDLNSKPVEVNSSPSDPTANIDLNKYIFGKITGEKIAFIIDTSISFSKFKDKVISSIQKSILELNKNQEFTIIFLSDGNVYFNDGKTVRATKQNKESAVEFLRNVPVEDSFEPITEAIQKIQIQNGKIDRIYFFGDGDDDPSKENMVGLTKNIIDNQALESVRKYGVPIIARSGYNDKYNYNPDLKFLQKLADATHGININKKL